jgi:hypothetical protein
MGKGGCRRGGFGCEGRICHVRCQDRRSDRVSNPPISQTSSLWDNLYLNIEILITLVTYHKTVREIRGHWPECSFSFGFGGRISCSLIVLCLNSQTPHTVSRTDQCAHLLFNVVPVFERREDTKGLYILDQYSVRRCVGRTCFVTCWLFISPGTSLGGCRTSYILVWVVFGWDSLVGEWSFRDYVKAPMSFLTPTTLCGLSGNLLYCWNS